MTPEQIAGNSESSHQKALFAWAALNVKQYPELKLMFHIPNGGARTALAGARLKAEGVKAGLPDLMLPAPRSGHGGLFLELKLIGGILTKEQMNWIDKLRKQGYAAMIVYGWEDARDAIVQYLNGEW